MKCALGACLEFTSIGFTGYRVHWIQGSLDPCVFCSSIPQSQAREICSLRRVCIDSARVVEELSYEVEGTCACNCC